MLSNSYKSVPNRWRVSNCNDQTSCKPNQHGEWPLYEVELLVVQSVRKSQESGVSLAPLEIPAVLQYGRFPIVRYFALDKQIIYRSSALTKSGGDGSPQRWPNRSLRATGSRKKTWTRNHGRLRISARKQGVRQRLREKGPHVKKRRVTEVVETPKLGE